MTACAGARATRLRLSARTSVLVGVIGLLVLLLGAQAASAAHLTSVAPTSGCPGTEVTFTGTAFTGAPTAQWADPAVQAGSPTSVEGTATLLSTTKATAVVPLFVQTVGTGVGTVQLDHSNAVPFAYPSILTCLKGATGATGVQGATGSTGLRGAGGEKGATGTTGESDRNNRRPGRDRCDRTNRPGRTDG